MSWIKNIKQLNNHLKKLSVRDANGKEISPDLAFALWLKLTNRTREDRKTVYLIGNGASASMASHMAADLSKNGLVHTEVFSDLSLITAIANDISYEEVFAIPLSRRMVEGDMLVAISSSGNSLNIVRAIEKANSLKGTVITLSAMKNDNLIRNMGTLNLYVSAETYGLAESCHASILHHWMDLVAEALPSSYVEENDINLTKLCLLEIN